MWRPRNADLDGDGDGYGDGVCRFNALYSTRMCVCAHVHVAACVLHATIAAAPPPSATINKLNGYLMYGYRRQTEPRRQIPLQLSPASIWRALLSARHVGHGFICCLPMLIFV